MFGDEKNENPSYEAPSGSDSPQTETPATAPAEPADDAGKEEPVSV